MRSGLLGWACAGLVACTGAASDDTGEPVVDTTGMTGMIGMIGTTSMTGTSSTTGADAPTSGEPPGTTTANDATSAEPLTSSTGASDTTGTSDAPGTSDTGDTTGEPAPVVHTLRITDQNRHYVEMHGGWGPHLRGLMRAGDGGLWFTADKGEDVLHNREILYFRRGPGEPAWTAVTSQPFVGGIQQNVATILVGDILYSYGVDIVASRLEECTLSVVDVNMHACAAVLISGSPHVTPPSSNYVGAAALGDGWRIVWWTVVGDNGGAGQFHYTYNYGGGWNGPVVTQLVPYNDLAYVHAMSTTDGRLLLAGQTFTGKYPDGTYNAVVAEVTPGQPVTFTELASGEPGVAAQTAADLWIDRVSESVHVLATTSDAAVRYYHRPGGAAWAEHVQPQHVFPDSYRARFMRAGDGPLHLVRGSASGTGVEVLRATDDAVDAAIDWSLAEPFAVVPPTAGFTAPSALYVESATYQTTPVGAVQFAMCGQYQVSDGEVWQGTLE